MAIFSKKKEIMETDGKFSAASLLVYTDMIIKVDFWFDFPLLTKWSKIDKLI